MAGRKVGYLQVTLTLIGFALSIWFGFRLMIWASQHWSEISDPYADPAENLLNLWRASRGVVLGLAIFGFTWIWALITSLTILNAARRQAASAAKPPVIR
jgi:hypothetical protein